MLNNMQQRHALKFAVLSNTQQQRILLNMARAARKRLTEGSNKNEADLIKAFDHRRRVTLSRESRATHLIRAFLKGTPYHQVEKGLRKHTLDPHYVVQHYFSLDGFKYLQFIQWLKT